MLASANNLLLHALPQNRRTSPFLFNLCNSAVWAVLFFFPAAAEDVTLSDVLWGMCYGAVLALFFLCKTQAMMLGPVSVTTFIGCTSLLLSTAFGVLYFRETVSAGQIVGIVLLMTGLFLSVFQKEEPTSSAAAKPNKAWGVWCFGFFLSGGATGIVFKLHQNSARRENIDSMMLCAAVTAVGLLGLLHLLTRKRTSAPRGLPSKKTVLLAVLCGVVSCGYNRLNVMLSGELPSMVFFPAFNGSVILLASLLASAFFGERLRPAQKAGLFIGICALLFIAGVF